jgi:hypothetical protein
MPWRIVMAKVKCDSFVDQSNLDNNRNLRKSEKTLQKSN